MFWGMIKSDAWMIHLSFGFSIVSIHVVVSLSIGTAESEHEHVVNVLGGIKRQDT